MIYKFVHMLEKWCEKRGKVFHIKGRDNNDELYLIRYFLFTSKWFSIYIHRFMRSDNDVHHDHPFDFVSYIVKGQYQENTLHPTYQLADKTWFVETIGTRKQGSWAYRKATTVHKVIVDKIYSFEERFDAPLTVIFLNKRWRDWGFWDHVGDNQGSGTGSWRKWVHWMTFLNLNADDKAKLAELRGHE